MAYPKLDRGNKAICHCLIPEGPEVPTLMKLMRPHLTKIPQCLPPPKFGQVRSCIPPPCFPHPLSKFYKSGFFLLLRFHLLHRIRCVSMGFVLSVPFLLVPALES